MTVQLTRGYAPLTEASRRRFDAGLRLVGELARAAMDDPGPAGFTGDFPSPLARVDLARPGSSSDQASSLRCQVGMSSPPGEGGSLIFEPFKEQRWTQKSM